MAGRIWRIDDALKMIEEAKYNPFVRSVATQVIRKRNIGHKDYLGQVRAIFDFVTERVRYVKDPFGYDQLSNPIRTIYEGVADCEDSAILLASLLQSVGFPTKLKLIATNGTTFDHIYVLAEVEMDDGVRWIPLDATLGRTKPIGYEVSYKRARIFE